MAVITDGLRIEFGYGSTPLTALSAVSWTDVTSSVLLRSGVQMNRGRSGQDTVARPGTLSFTLDNSVQKGTEGRFTLGGSNQISGFGLRIPVRVSCKYPFITNLVSNPSFETNTTGYGFGFSSPTPTIARSTTRAVQGSASGLVTWGTGASASQGCWISCTTTVGQVYTFSVWVYVPSGSPAVCADAAFVQSAANVTVKDQWVRTSVTFTAIASSTLVGVALRGAATSGQTCFIDGLMLEAGPMMSTYQEGTPANQSLWVGYVESLEMDWENGFRPVVKVTAADRLARFQLRTLPSLVKATQLSDSPALLYPLNETTGSTSAADQSGNSGPTLAVTQTGTGGTLDFGVSGTGPGPDQDTCAVISPVDASNGLSLTGNITYSSSTASTVELYFYAAANASGTLINHYTSASANLWWLNCNGSGKLWLYTSVLPTIQQISSSPNAYTPNAWNHVAVTQSVSAGTLTFTLYLNGVSQGTLTHTSNVIVDASQSAAIGAGGFSGRIAGVATYGSVLSATRITEHANVRYSLASYTAETVDAKFNRICSVASLPSTEYQVSGTTSATMSPFPVSGVSLLDAANQCAKAEAGVVYLDRSGKVTLAARASRYNASSSFTLPAPDIDKGTGFTADMSQIVNDATVARAAGITYRAVNSASVAAYDTHQYSASDVYVATDAQAVDTANWYANVNAVPAPRVTDIKVDLVTAATDLGTTAVSNILQAEVGQRFTVSGLPAASTPGSTLDLFIEGVSDSITPTSWTRSFVANPMLKSGAAAVLDSATYGLLNSSAILGF